MIRYAADALDDLDRLHTWLLIRSPNAADRFLVELRDAETRIASQAASYPVANHGEARKCLMRFGQSVYVIYFIEDGGRSGDRQSLAWPRSARLTAASAASGLTGAALWRGTPRHDH